MNALWPAVLAGAVAGALAAAVLLRLLSARSGRTVSAPVPVQPARYDCWARDLDRCARAVSRATSAVHSVSSAPAREGLLMVVRRMDAELPNVAALVELGRGLAAEDPPEQARGAQVRGRVRGQVADAAERFGSIAEELLEIVGRLVADPDLSRLHGDVAVLRDQFPLLRPMSAVFQQEPAAPMPPEPAALGPERSEPGRRDLGAEIRELEPGRRLPVRWEPDQPVACRHQSSTSPATAGAATSSPPAGSGDGSPRRSSTAAPDSVASDNAPATSHSS